MYNKLVAHVATINVDEKSFPMFRHVYSLLYHRDKKSCIAIISCCYEHSKTKLSPRMNMSYTRNYSNLYVRVLTESPQSLQ